MFFELLMLIFHPLISILLLHHYILCLREYVTVNKQGQTLSTQLNYGSNFSDEAGKVCCDGCHSCCQKRYHTGGYKRICWESYCLMTNTWTYLTNRSTIASVPGANTFDFPHLRLQIMGHHDWCPLDWYVVLFVIAICKSQHFSWLCSW